MSATTATITDNFYSSNSILVASNIAVVIAEGNG